MNKRIHNVQVGDLVRRCSFARPEHRGDIFMVMEVTAPIKYEHYRGDPLKTHEISLKLWEVTEPIDHTHYAPSNLYEVV